MSTRITKNAFLRLCLLAAISLSTVFMFQNCGGGMESTSTASVGGQGTPTPTPTPVPTPTPTPTPTCPQTTNTAPTVTSLSTSTVNFNLGMGANAGTSGTQNVTVNYTSGDTFSRIIDMNCQVQGNGTLGLNVNCNAPNTPVQTGSSTIAIAAGNNAECGSGTVTVNVTVEDAIVNAQGGAIAACNNLNRTSTAMTFTINVVNACLPTQRVNPSTLYDTGQMGRSVAIDGEWAVATAPGDEERGVDAGAAFVFRRTGTTWAQTQKIIPSNLAAGHLLTGVALSGNLMVLSAPLANSASGLAWIYQYNGTSWTEVQTLTPPTAGALFGAAVAVSGSTVAIGAPRANNGAGLNSGAVYLFSGAGFNSMTTLNPSGNNLVRGEFGTSLAMSGTTLAVGAPFPSSVTAREEAVYIFTNGALANKISHTVNATDRFGFSVSLDGNALLVGAPNHTAERGLAYYFSNAVGVTASSANTRTYVLADPNNMDKDHFGYSVALKGGRVLVAAPDKAESAPKFGAVYLFDTTAATQRFKIRSRLGDRSADSFGFSIGVSADGWLFSGALNDESTAGIDNSGSGYFIDLP